MQKQDILHTYFPYINNYNWGMYHYTKSLSIPLFISVEVISVNRNCGLMTYIFYKAVDIISAFFPEKLCQCTSLA